MTVATPDEEKLQTTKDVELQPKSNEYQITGMRFGMILLGLVFSIFVASIDNFILSTALMNITKEFKASDQITWVASSYLLTNTALQPLYGKFSDIFGRKIVTLFALTSFLIGSILCGLSTNIIMLIVSRAIAGIGGGGLISLSVIIISDIVPLERRGLYMGIVGANLAAASVIGPLLGGVLTDKISWRWAFYINIPICVIAILIIYFFLNLPNNNQDFKTKLARIDYTGTITLVIFIFFLALGLTWGGKDYAWNSPAVIISLVLSAIFLILFIFNEAKFAKEPIIPLHILTRNVICSVCHTFLNLAVIFTLIIYTPIYYQVIYGQTAINAGLQLLPLMLGLVICNILSGIFISKTGIYRPLSRIGSLICLLGACLMGSLMRKGISRAEEIIFLILIGSGIGLCGQTNIIITQAAVEPKDVAIATSLSNFSQSIGGVIGLAINGAVFQNVLSSYIQNHIPSGIDINSLMGKSLILSIKKAGTIQAIKYIYLTCIGYFILSTIVTGFLVHIPLEKPTVSGNEPVIELEANTKS